MGRKGPIFSAMLPSRLLPVLLALLAHGRVRAAPLMQHGIRELSSMTYRFVSLCVPKPAESAAFFSRYTGAVKVEDRSKYLTTFSESAVVEGVRLWYANGTMFSDVCFVNQEKSKPTGSMAPSAFNAALEDTHTMAPDDW